MYEYIKNNRLESRQKNTIENHSSSRFYSKSYLLDGTLWNNGRLIPLGILLVFLDIDGVVDDENG
jgi:hypothetical protein